MVLFVVLYVKYVECIGMQFDEKYFRIFVLGYMVLI